MKSPSILNQTLKKTPKTLRFRYKNLLYMIPHKMKPIKPLESFLNKFADKNSKTDINNTNYSQFEVYKQNGQYVNYSSLMDDDFMKNTYDFYRQKRAMR